MNFQSLCLHNVLNEIFDNKMQYNTLSQQMWWIDGKNVCFHPRG
jgi:hypothetical protein